MAGPFYFGRAFDAPPFFTFSATAAGGDQGAAPQLTIGVEEWIQDEQGMYVGAILWFKCKLCWEPIKTGGRPAESSVPWERLPPQEGRTFKLDFEDWESHPHIFGGPEGNEIIAWDRVFDDQLEITVTETSKSGVGTAPRGFFWPSKHYDHFFSKSFEDSFHLQRYGPAELITHRFRKGTSINDVLYPGSIGPYWFFNISGWPTPHLNGPSDPDWKPRTPFYLSKAKIG